MPEETSRVHWERVSKTWWSAAVGTVRQEKGVWTGFVYRNTRTGEAWAETKTGFTTALAAMRWVDNQSEN